MNMTRYDYRLYCKTESRWVTGTTSEPPVCCFNNNSHIIDANTITLVQTIGPQIVILAEEDTKTGGNYKCDGVAFTAAANSTTTHDIQFPFPINLLSTSSTLSSAHEGNIVNVYFVPDSIIGGITQIDGVNTDSILPVSSLALPNFIPGLSVTITDAQGSQSLGVVLSRDQNTNTVLVSGDPARAFSQGSELTASFAPQTGVLVGDAAMALPLQFSVTEELAAQLVVGAHASIAGSAVGNITAIAGTIVTVSGEILETAIAGSTVAFGMTPYTTSILDDCLPTNVLEVQDTCIQYGQVGMVLKLTDGVHVDDLGRITAIDKATKRMTVERAPSRSYAPGSYVMVTRYFIQDLEIGGSGSYDFSYGRNKGSYVPPGKIGRFAYTNKTDTDLRFSMKLEYLY